MTWCSISQCMEPQVSCGLHTRSRPGEEGKRLGMLSIIRHSFVSGSHRKRQGPAGGQTGGLDLSTVYPTKTSVPATRFFCSSLPPSFLSSRLPFRWIGGLGGVWNNRGLSRSNDITNSQAMVWMGTSDGFPRCRDKISAEWYVQSTCGSRRSGIGVRGKLFGFFCS